MTEGGKVVLGCDSNGVNDEAFMDAVASKLEAAGYEVEKLGIAPGPFAEYSYSSAASGTYGCYLMADSIVSIADYSGATGGANSSGSSFKMCVFGIRTDVIPKLESGWDSLTLSPDADCTSVCDKLAGHTYPEIEEICKSDTRIVHASTGEAMGDEVVKALGGQTSDGGSSASTIKEAIKEVMSAWDGEVECYIQDDRMYIHKIKPPVDDCDLLLAEGNNIHKNSVSIKDYCPKNINKLIVHWQGGEDIIMQDNVRIARFGVNEKELDAVKKVVIEYKEGEDSEDTSTTTTTTTDGDVETTEDTSKKDTKKESSGDNSKNYEEVPCETLEEAMDFARLEWGKCKRDDCHEIELETIGSPNWQQGQWVRLYLPSFYIDNYYYISRVSQTQSGSDYNASMTLVEYPPGFGSPEDFKSNDENEEETEDTTVSADTTNQGSDTNAATD